MAFAPQEPWLLDASLKDNILFGIDNPDKDAYHEAIRITGLTKDFMLMSKGDETYVSELNLSASQKQRVSLARCIAHNPDIVLMEDCLGDFDQSIAKRVFKDIVKKELVRNRCVIMLTQQLQYLPDCDRILVLKGGKMIDQGSYLDLKMRHENFSTWVSDVVQVEDDPNGTFEKLNEIKLEPISSPKTWEEKPNTLFPFSPMLRKESKPRSSPLASAAVITASNTIEQLLEQNSNSKQFMEINERTLSKMIEKSQGSVLTGNLSRPPANFSNQDIVTRTIEANQLTVHSIHTFDNKTAEPGVLDSNYKSNPWQSIIQFLKEGTGIFAGIALIVAFFIGTGIRVSSDVWLVFVSREDESQHVKNLLVYGGFCVAIGMSVVLRSFGFVHVILSKSRSWHRRILEAALCAPMSFYDSTPLGHILAFFTRHLFLVDEILPEAALQVLSFIPLLLGSIILVSVVVPYFVATLPAYVCMIYFVVKKCLIVQRKFQVLEGKDILKQPTTNLQCLLIYHQH
jgi:ABC-type multidrug transport system fused ATPase/permease subunit